jgi:hypothetical protein
MIMRRREDKTSVLLIKGLRSGWKFVEFLESEGEIGGKDGREGGGGKWE